MWTSALVAIFFFTAAARCGVPPAQTTAAPAPGPGRFATGAGPGSLAIADFNGDHHVDLAVANERSNDVTILLGDGKGSFARAAGSPFACGPNPNDLAVADFNRDGKPDLAFANHEQKYLSVLLGDGRGGFKPAPQSPFAVEVTPHTHGVAAGDVDGDGNADLVTDSWGNDQIEILFGDGKGSFATPGRFFSVGRHPYQRVRVADANRDGRMDVLTSNLEGGDVTVLLSVGSRSLKPAAGSPFRCGDGPFNFALGDLNGDGKLDLAVVNSPSSTPDVHGQDGLTILTGDGSGRFAMVNRSPLATGRIPNIAATGDVNGDGTDDVAVSSPDDDRVTLFRMSRSGTVLSSENLSIAGRPKGLAIADLNGDGKGDIIVSNNAADAVTVLLSN